MRLPRFTLGQTLRALAARRAVAAGASPGTLAGTVGGRLSALSKTGRGRERGMTLLEIMIVIAILGLLASVIVVGVMGQFENAKINSAKLQASKIKQALQMYQANNGAYPSQGEGLKVLTTAQGGMKASMKPDDIKDPWGNEFIYVESPRDGNEPFEVFSIGPDGQRGTDDDVKAK